MDPATSILSQRTRANATSATKRNPTRKGRKTQEAKETQAAQDGQDAADGQAQGLSPIDENGEPELEETHSDDDANTGNRRVKRPHPEPDQDQPNGKRRAH